MARTEGQVDILTAVAAGTLGLMIVGIVVALLHMSYYASDAPRMAISPGTVKVKLIDETGAGKGPDTVTPPPVREDGTKPPTPEPAGGAGKDAGGAGKEAGGKAPDVPPAPEK